MAVGSARSRGFTLLEILVVLIILGVIVASVGLELHATERVTVRDQSKKLALLVHALRQQAIVDGTPLGLRFGPRDYSFVELNAKGKWVPLPGDHLFRPRALPRGIHFQAVVHAAAGQRIVQVSPGGMLTPFTATLSDGGSHWKVTGRANGTVAAKPAV